MFIINARIHTMSAFGVIENGYLKIDCGKIADIGEMKNFKELDNDSLDLNGLNVYPGFIDAHTHLGMVENGLAFEGDDGNESVDPVTPQLRAIDAVNPTDKCFEEALHAGITTVITGPGSSNPIAGQMVAMKTYGKRIDSMILKDPISIKFALGENPKQSYNEKNQLPITRMAIASLIREQLCKAERYSKDKEKALEDIDLDEPEYDAKCEALIPLLKNEIPAHFHAHRADDIFTAIRIAKEFKIDYVIVHATEGHMITDELNKENAKILSGPFLCDRSKPELLNLTPESPGILSKSKVDTAIVTDHPVIPIQYLPICAALAVREGMDKEEALKAVTINAARICGIDSRVGSLEVGKDADLVVFSGDPLDLFSKPSFVFCNGLNIDL